jgi:hypothetical protein
MRNKYYIVIGIILALTSCQATKNKSEQKQIEQTNNSLIFGNIDTIKVISQLEIKETLSRLDLSNENIDNLSNHLDTLELTYYFGFCDCQRWIVSEIHKKASEEHPNLDKHDPRGQVEFNLDKHGYYIEAANEELKINWRTQVNGTTIRLIGREYKDKRLPEDGKFTVRDPPKGKVFRYYSYQILKPYQVWGHHKFIKIDKQTRDTIREPTILTVK